MSVRKVQSEVSSSEFLEWIAYLDEDANRFHREDYYFANIAAEIRRSYVKDPMKVKISSFLMKFTRAKKSEKLSVKERIAQSKAFWRGMLKIPKAKK